MSNKFQEYKQLDLSQINKEVLKRMKNMKETVNFSLQKTIDQQKRRKLLAMKGRQPGWNEGFMTRRYIFLIVDAAAILI